MDRCPTIRSLARRAVSAAPRTAALWRPADGRAVLGAGQLQRAGGRRDSSNGSRPTRATDSSSWRAAQGDAFLHANALHAAGHDTVPAGAKLDVQVGAGAKGAQVTRVLEVDTAGVVERPQRSSERRASGRAGSRPIPRPRSRSPERSNGSTTPRDSASSRARTAARTCSSISPSSARPAFRISPKASRSTCAWSTRPRDARRFRSRSERARADDRSKRCGASIAHAAGRPVAHVLYSQFALPIAAFERHSPPDRDHGGAARSRRRLPVGYRADLRDDRAVHDRRGLRSRRRDRARRRPKICARNSATCCCRSSFTPGWRKRRACSTSAAWSRRSPPSLSAAIRMSSATRAR